MIYDNYLPQVALQRRPFAKELSGPNDTHDWQSSYSTNLPPTSGITKMVPIGFDNVCVEERRCYIVS